MKGVFCFSSAGMRLLSLTQGKGEDLQERRKGFRQLCGLALTLSLFLFIPFLATAFAQEDEAAQLNLSVGKHLYKHYCAVCHGLSGKGDGKNADDLGDVHPTDLTSSEFDKYDDEEIYEVIEGGGAAVDISYYMPPWGAVFTEDQIDSIIVYIRTLSESQGGQSAEVVRVSTLGRIGKGKCLVCHAKEVSLLRPIGPNIGHEGSKWKPKALEAFLKEPGSLRPNGFMPFTKARMPNFYFTDQEVTALVDYLMTLKDEGVRRDVLVGWDSSDPALIEEGEFLFIEEFACDGCHKRSPGGEGGIVGPELSSAMERIQPEWVYSWLKNPQAIRPDTPMPNFKMSEKQLQAVLAYLLSLSESSPSTRTVADRTSNSSSIAKGKRLTEVKNCVGCHLMDSFNSQRVLLEVNRQAGLPDETEE